MKKIILTKKPARLSSATDIPTPAKDKAPNTAKNKKNPFILFN